MSVGARITGLIAWVLLASVAVLASIIWTNPATIGPVGVTVWFVVLFSDVAAGLTLLMYLAKSFLHLHATGVGRLRYSQRQALLVSGWLTGMLAMSSLRQFSLLDAILLALLLIIVEVYVRFRWP